MSDTVLPSTPESPGEMFVSPLGSESSTRQVTGKASPRLSGISKLVKTPKQRKSVDLSGLKSLVKTPKILTSPELSGVKQLMKTPKAQKSPALGGMKKVARTPKDVTGTPGLDGVRKLVKTPKPHKSPALEGVKKLMKTPKVQKSPALGGVKRLIMTPKDTAGSPKLGGVRRLVKTPKVQKSPSLLGIKKLLKTPKPRKSPQLAGVKSLMRTPKQQQSPVLAGVRQLMKTPKLGPRSPDFVGVSEMLTSPQTVSMGSLRQQSVPKKKAGKKISSPVLRVLSPKTRGRKICDKTSERQPEVNESSSGRKRVSYKSKLADEDHVVISKKLKLGKSVTETEMAKSRTEDKKVSEINSALSPVSHRGRGRYRRQEAEERDVSLSKDKKSKASSSTLVAKTLDQMSKSGMPEVVVDVSSRPKTPVKSRAKKTSKKVADATVLTSVDAVSKKSVTNATVVVTAISSPKRARRGGRVTKSTSSVATELSLAADNIAKVDSRKRTVQRTVAGDSVTEVQQAGGMKSRAARNQNKVVVVDRAESQEDTEVELKGRSTAKKTAAPVYSVKKAKKDVKTTKGKESHVDLASDRPNASRRGRSTKSKQVESTTPSKKVLDDHGSAGSAKSPLSTRRGKRKVTISKESLPEVESVKLQQKGKKSPVVSSVADGCKRKHQFVHEDPQKALEDTKIKTPSRSRGQKGRDIAEGKDSTAESAADNTVAVRRGKPPSGKQLESVSSSSVSTKSPVSIRRGRRQVAVEKSPDRAQSQEDTEVEVRGTSKAKKTAAPVYSEKDLAADRVDRVPGGRRGKQQVAENSNVKTPSRARKRPQTSEEAVDAPMYKRQRQHAEVSLVAEQPVRKAAKHGKSSEPAEPLIQPDKSQQKTQAKKVSQSVVKKSAGKKLDVKLKVLDDVSDSKLKKMKDAKVVIEKEMAVASPPATRSRRTKRT